MKKNYKHPFCLNCNRPLSSSDNFCPHCGQENNSHKRGLGVLLHDFFSNYFSFDSKITRSTVPFLIRPGQLTSYYNEGKRTSFVHPLRLYLIISFIFFLLLAFFIDKLVEEQKISLVADGKHFSISTDVSTEDAVKLQASLDSAQSKINRHEGVNVQIKLPDTAAIRKSGEVDNTYVGMFRDMSLTDEQVIDSVQMDKNSDFDRMVIHQARKIAQKDMDVFLPYLGKNFSILMFLLLPIFAFYLYVLFGRNERYYIGHAVHALHLHAFSFMVLTILLVLELSFEFVSTHKIALLFAFLIITLYALFSMKRVYRQSWFKTIFKFNVLGFFYFISLVVGAMLEAFISFVLF